MNSTGFEQISRLSYGNNKIFLKLKDLAGKSLSEDNPFTYLVMAYIYYIDCEFERSMELFNKFLKTNKEDLEATLGLAFCYRQLGDDKKFEKILTPI